MINDFDMWEMEDEIEKNNSHPLAPAKGILNGILLSLLFWAVIIGGLLLGSWLFGGQF